MIKDNKQVTADWQINHHRGYTRHSWTENLIVYSGCLSVSTNSRGIPLIQVKATVREEGNNTPSDFNFSHFPIFQECFLKGVLPCFKTFFFL